MLVFFFCRYLHNFLICFFFVLLFLPISRLKPSSWKHVWEWPEREFSIQEVKSNFKTEKHVIKTGLPFLLFIALSRYRLNECIRNFCIRNCIRNECIRNSVYCSPEVRIACKDKKRERYLLSIQKNTTCKM